MVEEIVSEILFFFVFLLSDWLKNISSEKLNVKYFMHTEISCRRPWCKNKPEFLFCVLKQEEK